MHHQPHLPHTLARRRRRHRRTPLPPDLIPKILSYIPPTPENRATLASCCLVSRAFYRVAREKLWENIEISIEKYGFNKTKRLLYVLKTPYPFLELLPPVALVRTLAVNVDPFAYYTALRGNVRHLGDRLAQVLEKLAALNRALPPRKEGRRLTTLGVYGSTERLYWSYFSPSLCQGLYAVSQLPSLHTLELHGIRRLPASLVIGATGARERLSLVKTSLCGDSVPWSLGQDYDRELAPEQREALEGMGVKFGKSLVEAYLQCMSPLDGMQPMPSGPSTTYQVEA